MRERLELKTHKTAVMLTTAWPMLLALLIMTGLTMLMMPWQFVLLIAGVMLAIILITFVVCIPMYLGTYLFLPPTEYKGARLIARLGRNESEIAGVTAAEIIVKQNFIEKAFKVCHIRQKGTAMYFRGVPEPEKVKAWVTANFPEKTAVMRNQEMKVSRKKKKK